MVTHCVNNSSKKDRLIELLDLHTKDQKLILEAINIMKASSSIDYAKRRAKEIIENAWSSVNNKLPENEGSKELLQLSQYLINRNI